MTTEVLNVTGAYLLRARGGVITLQPQIPTLNTATGLTTYAQGTVVINGNLDVKGQTTTIESQNATIKDNIIVLNSGELNNFVSLGKSGLKIARGPQGQDSDSQAAFLQYNDAVDNSGYTWHLPDGNNRHGIWEFKGEQNLISAIRVNAIRIDPSSAYSGSNNHPRLSVFGNDNANAIISVAGTVGYATNIGYVNPDPDDIPNVQWVQNWTQIAQQTPQNIRRLQQLNSSVLLTDNGIDAPDVKINLGGPNIRFTFKADGELRMDGLNSSLSIIDSAIQAVATTSTSQALFLGASGDAPIWNLNYQVLDNSTYGNAYWTAVKSALPSGATALYSSATNVVTGGGTNLFFVNKNNQTNGSGEIIPEELVSRRRALVYAIVF
jgi:hypothetical protein